MAFEELRMGVAPLHVGAVAAYPYTPELARRYTVRSRYEGQDPIQLFTRIDDATIGLPRGFCPPPSDATDGRCDGKPIQVQSSIVPRNDTQARVIKKMKALVGDHENFIAMCETGFGKTVCAIDVMAAYGRTALIVAPKDDLLDQWVDRITQFTNLPREAIGRLQGDTCKVDGYPIVLGSLASLAKPNRYPPWVYTYFGQFWADECHRLGADTFGRVAGMFPARLRVGLSATPKRADGKDVVFHGHIGPIMVRGGSTVLTPRVLRFPTQWTCPRDNNGRRVPHTPGRIALLGKSLSRNVSRNALICAMVKMAYAKGRKIVVFSSLIEHLETLQLHLSSSIPPGQITKYYGKTTKAELAAAAKGRVIMATYSKMGEGTDIPALDTCILAYPMSKVEQVVGRILRPHEGKKEPLVVDLADPDSSVLAKYTASRQFFYRKINAPIQDMEWSPDT